MKPYVHAESSARRFKGKPEDYLAIHNWFDQTKAHFPDMRHRAILHSSFGIYLAEQVFGVTITNSDGLKVSVREVGEQHVLEDMRGRGIPTVQDYLCCMEYQPWMSGEDSPPSSRSLKQKPDKSTNTFITPEVSAADAIVDGSRIFDKTEPTDVIVTPKGIRQRPGRPITYD